MSEAVEICDVAPRDGFQVIKEPIPTAAKGRVVELQPTDESVVRVDAQV